MASSRAQAYTLESVIAAIVILTAVLFALQAVFITPTTSGAVDPGVRDELRQQASDILVVSAQNATFSLSDQIRYWDQNTRTFVGGRNARVGYGSSPPPGMFGTMLNRTFSERNRLYNVELRYRGENATQESESLPLVYRGTPGEGSVVATTTVTLYDNQTLSGPRASNRGLWEYDTNATDNDGGYYPIPNAVEGPVYNVVEVRVVVW